MNKEDSQDLGIRVIFVWLKFFKHKTTPEERLHRKNHTRFNNRPIRFIEQANHTIRSRALLRPRPEIVKKDSASSWVQRITFFSFVTTISIKSKRLLSSLRLVVEKRELKWWTRKDPIFSLSLMGKITSVTFIIIQLEKIKKYRRTHKRQKVLEKTLERNDSCFLTI